MKLECDRDAQCRERKSPCWSFLNACSNIQVQEKQNLRSLGCQASQVVLVTCVDSDCGHFKSRVVLSLLLSPTVYAAWSQDGFQCKAAHHGHSPRLVYDNCFVCFRSSQKDLWRKLRNMLKSAGLKNKSFLAGLSLPESSFKCDRSQHGNNIEPL